MGQFIDLGFGKANLSKTLATYAALKVTAPFAKVTAINSGTQVSGSKQWTPFGRHDLNGGFSTSRVEHDNGTIILLQTSWKRGGASLRDAALFLRLRAGAPLYNVRARVPTGVENICGDSFLMFSGNADILVQSELTVMGLQPSRQFITCFMDATEIGECFTVRQMQPETAPRPALQAIATERGIVMREVAPSPVRRMNFRKGA